MGGCYSTEYYFGFINISFSHLDVLSFVLGFGFALGMQALWNYCKNTRRASQHILGKVSAKNWGLGQLPAASCQPPAASYLPYPMPPPLPPSPGVMQSTAPPAAQATAVVPWKYQSNMAV